MLDIKFIRQNPDVVKANLSRRNDPKVVEMVDSLLVKDVLWKKEKGELDFLRGQRNTLSQEINKAKKEGNDIKTLLEKVKALPKQIADKEAIVTKLEEEIKFYLLRIPNLLHESVPDGEDANGNIVVATFGKKPVFHFPVKNHIEVMEGLGVVDIDRAAKLSGARFYFLKGALAQLELGLQKYAADFITQRGFSLTMPPFMMNKRAYEGVVDLGAFEEALYKIDGEDLFLIATSEHPLTAMYMDETFEESHLPVRMAGYSTCFRKEAGAHGLDTKGIFRVHQFNKVEQVVICREADSWLIHEELRKNIEEFFASLGLHFRTVSLCSGDIGKVVAKTYDCEVFMPASGEFRELGSCSNCTSFQAVGLNMRVKTNGASVFVHTLNSTLIPTARALAIIIENYQQADGSVKIPDVLVPYMNGMTQIKKASG